MVRTKITISDVNIDKSYDGIKTVIDGASIQIVFAKSENVRRFLGKEVYISKELGADYILEELDQENACDEQIANEDIIESFDMLKNEASE